MDRKFSTNRTYNLIKFIVNAITVLAIISAILLSFNEKKNLDYFDSVYTKCRQSGQDQETLVFCGTVWVNSTLDYKDNLKKTKYIAVFLPLIFYASTALFKYLFPRETPTKEQSKQDRENQTNYEWENQRLKEHLKQSDDRSNVNPEILKPKFRQ